MYHRSDAVTLARCGTQWLAAACGCSPRLSVGTRVLGTFATRFDLVSTNCQKSRAYSNRHLGPRDLALSSPVAVRTNHPSTHFFPVSSGCVRVPDFGADHRASVTCTAGPRNAVKRKIKYIRCGLAGGVQNPPFDTQAAVSPLSAVEAHPPRLRHLVCPRRSTQHTPCLSRHVATATADRPPSLALVPKSCTWTPSPGAADLVATPAHVPCATCIVVGLGGRRRTWIGA